MQRRIQIKQVMAFAVMAVCALGSMATSQAVVSDQSCPAKSDAPDTAVNYTSAESGGGTASFELTGTGAGSMFSNSIEVHGKTDQADGVEVFTGPLSARQKGLSLCGFGISPASQPECEDAGEKVVFDGELVFYHQCVKCELDIIKTAPLGSLSYTVVFTFCTDGSVISDSVL